MLELSRVDSCFGQVDFGQAAPAVVLACPDMAAGSADEFFDRSKIGENPVRVRAGRLAARGADRDHDVIGREHLASILGDGPLVSRVFGLERQLAAFRHGITRHDREAQDRRHELTGIDQRRCDIGRRDRGHLDLFAECRPEQAGRLGKQRVDVDATGLRGLAPREGKQMRCQGGAACGGIVDQFRNRGEVRPVRDSIRQDFDRAGDDGQDIVEIMQDAAGELTDDENSLNPVLLRLGRFHWRRLAAHFLEVRRRLLFASLVRARYLR
jgi:hypothetical protein